MRSTELTRWSLAYPASYLLTSGLGLLAAPEPYLRLLLSDGEYGAVFPRLAGALIFGLGIIVAQVIRHRVEALYPTLVGVRVLFCACWAALFVQSRDPFFLLLFGTVGFGVLLTTAAHVLDGRASRPALAGAGA